MDRSEIYLIAVLAVLLLALTALQPVYCQSLNNSAVDEYSAVEKLNVLVEQDKEGLINATQELVRIKSVRDLPQPSAPFGEGPAKALDKALQIASDLGFATSNLDGYIGYAEYGQGYRALPFHHHRGTLRLGQLQHQ